MIDAFATVPRERFAGPGPWRILHFADGYWTTPDADPRRLYHNVLIALDEERRLNIGEPLLWARHFDRIGVKDGDRVLQIGMGSGYYTAILAELVGRERPSRRHRDRCAAAPRRPGAISRPGPRPMSRWATPACRSTAKWDLIVAFAGATAPHAWWLDGLADGGRLLLPLTAGNFSPRSGFMLRLDRAATAWPHARPVGSASIPAPAHAAPRTRQRWMPPLPIRPGNRPCAACAATRTKRMIRAGCIATAGACPSASCTDGPAAEALRLPVVRRGHEQVERPLRILRRVEHHRRGSSPRARPGRRRPGARRQGPHARVRRPARLDAAAAPLPQRHRRIRPRLRRRPGRGLGPADRRRSRHRQVDAPAAGRGGTGAPAHGLRLYLGRGGARPGAPARRAAGPGRCAGAAHRRDLGARHRGDAGAARRAQGRGDRFDPDHVARHDRQHAGHGEPGARARRRRWSSSPSGAASRCCWSATSPRTAPSPARACSSTWSTRCSISRASAATTSASCAR